MHRLLAEYRQTLLLQQSLHTNSMSTPNLAASQELHTANPNGFSNGSNPAAAAIASAGGTVPQSFEEGCCIHRASAQRRNESHGPGGSCHEYVNFTL